MSLSSQQILPIFIHLTVARTGQLTISLSVADGSRFVGDVALLNPDLRLLVERGFSDDSGVVPVTFTQYADPGRYLVREQSLTSDSAVLQLRTHFMPASNPIQPITVGGGPQMVKLVDLNGDGHVDLVTANLDSADVSVLLGRGEGMFEIQRRFAVGFYGLAIVGSGQFPFSMQVEDVNGDGRVDIVAPIASSDDVSVLLGRGDGTFQDERQYGLGDTSLDVQVVDVNSDGRVDLVKYVSGVHYSGSSIQVPSARRV